MSGEDIRKLLGGYATGTLSKDEQQALFEAALRDEKLFAALAVEQALREMLDDPANRAAVLRALEPPPARGWAWRWMVPVGIAAGLVVITSVIFVFQRPTAPSTFEMAKALPNIAPNVIQPALQPEVQVAQRALPSEPSAQPRQVLEQAPAAALSRRDVREEPKAIALGTSLPAGPVAVTAPATAAPPAPALGQVMELRSSKKDSAEVKSESGNVAGAPGKVQYTILKRGADGQFRPVDAGSTLQPADVVRLHVETEEAGFLAVSQSVSQKTTPKMLFQGAVRKQVPVTIPATGSLDLSNAGALQILFSQPSASGGFQNALLPGSSLSKRKAMADAVSEKSGVGGGASNQAASKDQTAGVVTVDVNLNVATPAQQQK